MAPVNWNLEDGRRPYPTAQELAGSVLHQVASQPIKVKHEQKQEPPSVSQPTSISQSETAAQPQQPPPAPPTAPPQSATTISAPPPKSGYEYLMESDGDSD